MENIIKLVIIMLLILPGNVLAVTECNYVELADHFEAVCEGDEKSLAAPVNKVSVTDPAQALPAAHLKRIKDAGGSVAVKSTAGQQMSPGSNNQSAMKKSETNDHATVTASVKHSAINAMLSSRGNQITRDIVDSKQAMRIKSIKMGK